MSTLPAANLDPVRQSFADQFEPDGSGFIYRRSQKGEALKVSADEYRNFIDEFDRNVSRSKLIMYVGLGIVLGGMILFSLIKDFDLNESAIFAGIAVVFIPYFAFYRWAWGAPSRALAGRVPFAGERSPDEVRRLRFQRITYGKLATAAGAGLALPLVMGSRQDLFSGWGRLWLVLGAALVLLAAVQAFRKWQIERDDTYALAARPLASAGTKQPSNDSSSPSTALWRYSLLAIALAAIAFVIFAPAGKQFAQSPSFWLLLGIGGGAWALITVVRGFTTGQIEPFVRGLHNTYQRDTQPKRFWASMAWNGMFGCLLIWGSIAMSIQSAADRLEARCYNEKGTYSVSDAHAACERMIRESTAAIGRRPDDASAYFKRGYVYEQMGDMKPAIADFDQVIRLTPDDSNAYFNRGYAYEHLGDLNHTITDFSQVVRLSPGETNAYYYRWAAYKDLGDDKQAAADLAVIDRLDPKLAAQLRGNR